MTIKNGWLDIARQVPSSNCGNRGASPISLIVIHCISLPAGHFGNNFVESLFCNRITGSEHYDFVHLPKLKVSSHLFVRRSGVVVQFVPLDQRAWHAGESIYKGMASCNDYSIGIELEGTDSSDFTAEQYTVLAGICAQIQQQWPVLTEDIVGHSDIAPGRKTDPGIGFNWSLFRRELSKIESLKNVN